MRERAAVAIRTKHRVLVVDVDRPSAEAICAQMFELGHDARPARSGLSALSIVEAFKPDIVLVDVGVADITAYEVARRLRAANDRRYLVAIAEGSHLTDWIRALAAGFDRHLTKPLDGTKLRALVSSYGGKQNLRDGSARH